MSFLHAFDLTYPDRASAPDRRQVEQKPDRRFDVVSSDAKAAAPHLSCFFGPALLKTQRGEVAAQDLSVGDRVLTRDNGYQTVRWLAHRRVSQDRVSSDRRFMPIFIPQGAFATFGPERDLWLGPDQRVLFDDGFVELLFGMEQVLLTARDLDGLWGIERRPAPAAMFDYIHVLTDGHELVQADGLWVETLQPGDPVFSGLEATTAMSLKRHLAQDGVPSVFPAARTELKAHQVKVLFNAVRQRKN